MSNQERDKYLTEAMGDCWHTKHISKGDQVTMNCPRCNGKMYSEKFYDFVRSFEAHKCINCGEVIDPTILANRLRKEKKDE